MKKFFDYCIIRLYYLILRLRALFIITIARRRKMIFMFGTPAHTNLGDQAQTYCIIKWLQHNYPDYGILSFSYPETYGFMLSILRKTIRKDDQISIQSGYNMTDLYKQQNVNCKVVEKLQGRSIWIFPQTVHYQKERNLIKTANIMNSHGMITLMARDEISYSTIQKYFTNCKLLLFPDIVSSMIGTQTYDTVREGILFCIRNDKEAFYKKDEINVLKKRLLIKKISVEETDTTLNMPLIRLLNNREEILHSELNYYAHFKVMITDRYHGIIFSLITGTPVVVLKTNDHKLTSGVNWFPVQFGDYISFAENLDEAYETALDMNNRQLTHHLPTYFKDKYYDNLKTILENDRS